MARNYDCLPAQTTPELDEEEGCTLTAPARPNHLAGAFPSPPPPGDPGALLAGCGELDLYYPTLVDDPESGAREMLFDCFIGRYCEFAQALARVNEAARCESQQLQGSDPAREAKLLAVPAGLARATASAREAPTERELDLLLASIGPERLADSADWIQAVYADRTPALLDRLSLHAARRYGADPDTHDRVSRLMATLGVGSVAQSAVLSGGPEVEGRTVEDVAGELQGRAEGYLGSIEGLQATARDSQRREQDWLNELGVVGRFVELFNDRERPDPGRWSLVLATRDEAGARFQQLLVLAPDAENLQLMGETGAQALRLFDEAQQQDSEQRAAFMRYLRGFSDSADGAVTGFTVARDLCFATAVSLAVVLAAPVVAGAAGGVATGALGLSGASATAFTGASTGAAMGALGAAMEGAGRLTAESIHQEQLVLESLLDEQGSLLAAVSAFDFSAIADAGWQGFKSGFLDGVLGTAGMALEKAILAKVAMRPVMMGTSVLGTALTRAKEAAIASGASGAIVGGLDGALRTAMNGGSVEEVIQAAETGFVLGGALGAAMGGLGGAWGGAREGMQADQWAQVQEMKQKMNDWLATDPERFATEYNRLVQSMTPQQKAAFETELNGRRFVDFEHTDAGANARVNGDPEAARRQPKPEDFEAWSQAEELLNPDKHPENLLDEGLLQRAHQALPDSREGSHSGKLRGDPDIDRADPFMSPDVGEGLGFRRLTPAQLEVLRSNPHLDVENVGVADHLLSAEERAANIQSAMIYYPDQGRVPGLLDNYVRWYWKNEHIGDPVAFAAEAQRRLASIHPFFTDDGQLSRLIMDRALMQRGLPPASLARPELDLFVTPEEWERQVRSGVMSSYSLALKHAEVFNLGCELLEPALMASGWGGLLGLANNTDALVEWAYGRG